MIAVIDYGMGNLRSVEKGFHKVGIDVKVTNSPQVVKDARGVVLPGVGAFRDCMRELTNLELVDAVVDSIKQGKPYLGICLGLQVLFSQSEEFGSCRGLDLFRGNVVRFPASEHKVPHMGWNGLSIRQKDPFFTDIENGAYFYFVHSYYVVPDDASLIATTTDYCMEFTSAIQKDNIFAVQFHPEKSQALGLRLLKNFAQFVSKAQ